MKKGAPRLDLETIKENRIRILEGTYSFIADGQQEVFEMRPIDKANRCRPWRPVGRQRRAQLDHGHRSDARVSDAAPDPAVHRCRPQ